MGSVCSLPVSARGKVFSCVVSSLPVALSPPLAACVSLHWLELNDYKRNRDTDPSFTFVDFLVMHKTVNHRGWLACMYQWGWG